MSKMVKILHIEDNLVEVNLVKEAFEEARINRELSVTRDGEEAIRYLYKKNEFCNASRPDIILLDLNLPKKNGFEVLAVIKGDAKLKSIPVFIFTGSESKNDIFKAYQLHANGYIRKPNNFSDYVIFFSKLVDFWGLTIVPPEMDSLS